MTSTMKLDPLYPLITEVLSLCQELSDLPTKAPISYAHTGKREFYGRILCSAFSVEDIRRKLAKIKQQSSGNKDYTLSSLNPDNIADLLVVCPAYLDQICEPEPRDLSEKQSKLKEKLLIYVREQNRSDVCRLVLIAATNPKRAVRHIYAQRIMDELNGDLKAAKILNELMP